MNVKGNIVLSMVISGGFAGVAGAMEGLGTYGYMSIMSGFTGVGFDGIAVGFKAGVKAVNPDAEIAVQYVESFNDQTTAQQIANTMYSQGADIIYHAAGDSGNGLFTEAINRARNGENVWVIGVDADQYEQGVYGR